VEARSNNVKAKDSVLSGVTLLLIGWELGSSQRHPWDLHKTDEKLLGIPK